MTEEQDGGMSRDEAIAMLKRKVGEWNMYRQDHPGWNPDLSGAGLGGANLTRADLSQANLCNADLSDAKLRGANLIGADLSHANLVGADLSQAKLRAAILAASFFGYTSFGTNDLSEVKGLDTVRHVGASYVDIHTLMKSRGKIPRYFLRRCGMPEGWVDYYPSLIGMLGPIQFHSCFISHSTDDKVFCEKLYQALQTKNVSVFYAPEDLKGGDWFDTQLEQAIEVHDKLLLVLSESSMASQWVENEIRWAFAKEKKTDARVLFPIRICDWDTVSEWECLDTDTGVNLARKVRRYNILDFTEDELTFEEALTRLIKDLQTDEKPDAHD